MKNKTSLNTRIAKISGIIMFLMFCMNPIDLFAQEFKVSGIVRSGTDLLPLPGANVYIKGSTIGTVTDLDGKFSITVPDKNSILIFSYVGYNQEELEVKGQPEITIDLVPDLKNLDEVVVIGYGTQRRKDVTGAVASVSEEKLKEVPSTSLNQALQGRIPGVQVVQGDPRPGGSITVRIRGNSSINAGNDPIYVVDGVIMKGTLNNINPDDIATVDILMDASAAAIYGSRGSNGVVLITTKKGKAGEFRVNYDGWTGFQSYSKIVEMLNGKEIHDLRMDAVKNVIWDANPDKVFTQNELDSIETSWFSPIELESYRSGKSYNWLDEITQTGIQQSHTFSASGGEAGTRFYTSFNLLDHTGLLVGSHFKRYTGRLNLDQDVKKWFKIGTNTSFSRTNDQRVDNSYFFPALNGNPLYPVNDTTITLFWNKFPYGENPILSKNIDWVNTANRITTNNYALITFLPNLTFKTSLGLDIVNERNYIYRPRNTKQGFEKNGEAYVDNPQWIDWLWENILTYTQLFNNTHSVTAMAGYTMQENLYETNSMSAENFANDLLGYKDIGSAAKKTTQDSYFSRWALISYIARLNYAYKNKYLITATERIDGSSKFGAKHKYGYFPSFALAWRLSEEPVLKNMGIFDELKLRAGWGMLGNQEISPYLTQTQYYSSVFSFNGIPVNSYSSTVSGYLGNQDIFWESEQQYNVGFDLAFWKERINISTNFYKTINDGLLFDKPLPVTTGYQKVKTNIGRLENKGIELNLSAILIQNSKMSWDISANLAANREKITKLYGGLTELKDSRLFVGEPQGVYYDYVYDGLWQVEDQEQIDQVFSQYNYHPGDIRVKDLDMNDTIDYRDRKIVGYSDPKFYGAFSTTLRYKGLSMTTNFNFVYGNKRYNELYYYYMTGRGYGENNLKDMLNRWTPQNTNTNIPRAYMDVTNRHQGTSWAIQNASYLRLKTITLAYDFPKKWLSYAKMNSLRIYATGNNLWTFTKFKGFDPEGGNGYPMAKMYVFGVNIGL